MKIKARTDLSANQVSKLIEQYYGYRVHNIQKVRAVYKVETDQGVYAFKSAKKMKDIHFIHSVLEHLYINGFQQISILQKTKKNSWLLHHDKEDYVVEQWLPDAVKEVNVQDDKWLFPAGKALAIFHQAISAFAVGLIPKNRVRRTWGDWFISKYQKLKQHRSWDHSEELDWLLFQMKLAKDQYKRHPIITTNLCHGSLHQENIMMDSNEKVWLIDYERLTYDAIGKDIAQVLMYHFRFHSWNHMAVEQLLSGYQMISPLSQADMHHICTRSLVPERMIYAYLDGKPLVADWEQEIAKEAVWKRLIPSYWKK